MSTHWCLDTKSRENRWFKHHVRRVDYRDDGLRPASATRNNGNSESVIMMESILDSCSRKIRLRQILSKM